jgi:CTP:molybdopterin cytidylyltransferase MocA
MPSQAPPPPSRITGLLVAAGGGRRAGGPKALRRDADGTSWLVRSVLVLLDGGCDDVLVVVGSAGAEATALLRVELATEAGWRTVEAPGWSEGLSTSLRTGLTALLAEDQAAVLVHLVDLPDVTAEVVSRLLSAAPPGPATLARAAYRGRPGHPVLIGASHLAPLTAELAAAPPDVADTGARGYLAGQPAVLLVECGDLASGQDRDGLD